MSRAMAKAQKEAHREEGKSYCCVRTVRNSNFRLILTLPIFVPPDGNRKKEEQEARCRLDAVDKASRDAENARLVSNEEAIKQEIDDQWATYMAGEAMAEEERVRTKGAAQQSAIAERLTFLKQEFNGVIANIMAKKVPNEEIMLSREKYVIIRQNIAKGTMANLYKSKDPNQRDLVVKVTPLKHDSNLRYIKRYEATFPLLRYLQTHPHPNIVPIYEIFISPDKAYVFMDIMEKDDLRMKIKNGAVSEQQAYQWVREIGQGLSYLHRIGVAHENLKPDSIVFDQTGRARIAGLGSLVVWYNADSDQVIKQTGNTKDSFHHHYAPERRKADGYDPARADIWSLGCLLVVMMTKEWPFAENSKHSKNIEWKLCFKKTGVLLSNQTWTLLTSVFQVEPDQRPLCDDVLEMMAMSS